jgi:hypothetical protein
MSVDAMARLAAANPVIDPPAIESPERLRRLIEDDAPALDLGELPGGRSTTRKSSRLRRRVLVAVPLCAAASVVGVVLSSGSSGPGVNVAAAAYAATSPKSGIVEATFITHIERGIQAGSIWRQREWDDAGKGLRRERVIFTEAYDGKRETHISESASAPGHLETWYRGRLEVSPVPRVKAPLKLRMIFGEVTLDGVQGIALYRALYREGLIRLVGRERRNGLSLWKLESRAASFDANGHKSPIDTRLVVLVDPKTFLPIVERQIDVALSGHPTVSESDLLSYRQLPAGAGHGKLFELTAQHPSARVLRGLDAPQSRTLPKRH